MKCSNASCGRDAVVNGTCRACGTVQNPVKEEKAVLDDPHAPQPKPEPKAK